MGGIVSISSEGAFDSSIRKAINSNFNSLGGAVIAVGNTYFLDPANGNDNNSGTSSSSAFQTLNVAYGRCVAGNNDVVVLMANGAASATARVDAAFTWSKNETHLVGFCAPVLLSQRSRIAPTGTTTAFTPFFTISGSGCIFQNVEWFHGFNTGTTAMINMIVTGSHNYFVNCHIAGMGDAASAADAGSRSLKLGGSGAGENLFLNCTVGIDTGTKRTGANASVEFTGDAVRNVFRRCVFPFWCSATSPLGILGTGAACVDRWQLFDECLFVNSIKSSAGSAIAVLGSFTSAAPGGLVVFKRCTLVGVTAYGDTNFLANSYIDSPLVVNNGWAAVNPA